MRRKCRWKIGSIVIWTCSWLSLSAATAVNYTWTGADGDGKWSNENNWSPTGVPTKDDNVTFDGTAANPDATVDADFTGGQLNSLTLAATYTGTLTLAHALRMNTDFIQQSGTVDCQTFEFAVIGGDIFSGNGARAGRFIHTAGTFKAPTGGAQLLFYPRFVGSGATFAIGATGFDCGTDSHLVVGGSYNSGSAQYFLATNQTFRTIEFGGTSGTSFRGTGNLVKTKFIHSGGPLSDAKGSTSSRPGGASFTIEGDIEAKGKAGGGNLELLLNVAGDQKIEFGTPTTTAANRVDWTPRLPGLHINKPSGTVKVSGQQAHFGRGPGSAAGCCWGLYVEKGTLDFGDVDLCSFGCESTTLEVSEGANIVWGTNTLFLTRNCTIKGDHVFNNLESDLQANYTINFYPWNATNTVLGDVRFTGGKISGTTRSGSQDYYERHYTALKVYGDVYEDGAKNANGGTVGGGMINLLLCNAEKDQAIYARNGGCVPNIIVDKPADLKVTGVSLDGSAIGFGPNGVNNSGGYLEIHSGTFVAPAEGLMFTNIHNGGILQTGGKLKMNRAPVSFVGGLATEGGYSTLGVRDELADVTLDIPYMYGNLRTLGLQIPAGYTNVINGKFLFKRGRIASANVNSAAMEFRGDYEIASHDAVGVNGSIIFGGTNDQHYVNTGGYTNINSIITIAKTGGMLILDNDLDLRYRRAWTTARTEYGPTTALAFNCLSGTIYPNGHRLLLPTGTTTVADGFIFALPISGVSEPPFVTLGNLKLPASGTPNVSFVGRPTPSMPQSFALWSYGTLTNPDISWGFVGSNRIGRPTVVNDAENQRLTFNCFYRTPMQVIVR